MSFEKPPGSEEAVCVLSLLGRVQLLETPGTVNCQVPLPTRFSRPEHWAGFPCPPPGPLPDPGIEPSFLKSPAVVCGFFTPIG